MPRASFIFWYKEKGLCLLSPLLILFSFSVYLISSILFHPNPPTDVQTKVEPVSPSSSINSEASLLSAESPNQVSINFSFSFQTLQ